jgi:Ca2+-binding RTX toxin-like protein
MRSTAARLLCTALLALAPLWGEGCESAGARFDAATGVLSIVGTEGPDTFVVSATEDGSIVVNDGALPIRGGVPTLANTVRIDLRGLAGDDRLVLSELGGPLPAATFVGGAGADVLIGGSGDDEFVWNPGDGRDTIEGRAGSDTLVFHGSDVGESFDLSANGTRVRLSRDVGAITADLAGVETIELVGGAGNDTVVVNDLTGTDLQEVGVDLGVTSGGDAQPDSVIVHGTDGPDVVQIQGDASLVSVIGLSAQVDITGGEMDLDTLTIDAEAGDDAVTASSLAASGLALTIDGGPGNDVLGGGAGDDVLLGGEGDDVLIGGPGFDRLDGGPGNNILIQ